MCDARKNTCCQAANSALASYLTFITDLTGRLPGLVAAAFPDATVAAARTNLALAALQVLNVAISNAFVQLSRSKCKSKGCGQVATAILNVGISFANDILAAATNPAIPLVGTPGVPSLADVLNLLVGSALVPGQAQGAITAALRGCDRRDKKWEKECESDDECEKEYKKRCPCRRPLKIKPNRHCEEEEEKKHCDCKRRRRRCEKDY
jgi:hypothetical protein